jgi:hypothetical protein
VVGIERVAVPFPDIQTAIGALHRWNPQIVRLSLRQAAGWSKRTER